jgi:hypothetical protein
MPTLSRLRRAPWLGGAVLLALAAGLVAPLALALGLRGWPFYAGLGAGLILLFGAIERSWQRRPLPRPKRPAGRGRFRILPGGKGNGHTDDQPGDDEGDKPRWLM